MPPKVSVQTGGDGGKSIMAAMAKLSRDQVLVGIPEAKTGRKQGKVTNAQLLFIHTHGSALRRLPARPVLEPAMDDAQGRSLYTPPLMAAASAALDGNPQQVSRNLERAGMVASGFARDWFTNPRNNWAALSPLSIRGKLAKLKGKGRAAAQAQIAVQGDTAGVLTTLVDTGQLRRAITYVVEEG